MHFLMLSCLHATELIEKQFVGRLSWIQKLQLRIHTRACQICNNYQEQSIIIHEALLKQANNSDLEKENAVKPGELAEFKQQVILQLEKY